jgi:hypothetical protein
MRFRNYPLFITGILLIVLLFLSCKEDVTSNDTSIIGKWEVYDALRNNQPTSTLQNAYFEFVNDSIMKTNILGKEMESPYEFGPKKKSIRQYSIPLMEFQIRDQTQDTIKLVAKIQDYSFQFFLARK